MMLIDMTNELAPILIGFNVVLIVSALALVGQTVLSGWFRSLGRVERRPVSLHRPVLVR